MRKKEAIMNIDKLHAEKIIALLDKNTNSSTLFPRTPLSFLTPPSLPVKTSQPRPILSGNNNRDNGWWDWKHAKFPKNLQIVEWQTGRQSGLSTVKDQNLFAHLLCAHCISS